MSRPSSWRIAVVLALGVMGLVAHAGGSIALSDAMTNFNAPPALIDEFEGAIRAANVAADNVICNATRFGCHWTHLGGGRASPYYECRIGDKTLIITGTPEYRDGAGNVLDENLPDIHERAATHRDIDIKWEWK
jgi:hypothetical protein